jgi:hypothetical protein
MNREEIFTALFDKLRGGTFFACVSRKLRHIDDVRPDEMPALFMNCRNQTVEQRQRLPAVYRLPVDLYVYVRATDDRLTQQWLNDALDDIDALLAPAYWSPAETLGVGNVAHVRVQGDIVTDEGTLGEVGIAIVPVEIIANA